MGHGPAKKAVIDASSAILLHKADLFRPMARMVELCMTRTVFEEITVAAYPGAALFRRMHEEERLFERIDPAAPVTDPTISGTLHTGERETIDACLAGAADFIIIDDGKGAGLCRRRGIPYINALLCPKLLFFASRIDEAQCLAKEDLLIRIGRYSAQVVAFARQCAEKDLAFFIP